MPGNCGDRSCIQAGEVPHIESRFFGCFHNHEHRRLVVEPDAASPGFYAFGERNFMNERLAAQAGKADMPDVVACVFQEETVNRIPEAVAVGEIAHSEEQRNEQANCT